MSGMKIRSLEVSSNLSAFHRWSSQSATALLLSGEMELLCGGYKWVSRFEVLCIPTRWTGEGWVEQISRFHGTTYKRQCDSHAAKLSRLNVCENRKVVRWCTQQWTIKYFYDAIIVFRIENFVVNKVTFASFMGTDRTNHRLLCRTEASSHNLQRAVYAGINEAGVTTAAWDRSALLC